MASVACIHIKNRRCPKEPCAVTTARKPPRAQSTPSLQPNRDGPVSQEVRNLMPRARLQCPNNENKSAGTGFKQQ